MDIQLRNVLRHQLRGHEYKALHDKFHELLKQTVFQEVSLVRWWPIRPCSGSYHDLPHDIVPSASHILVYKRLVGMHLSKNILQIYALVRLRDVPVSGAVQSLSTLLNSQLSIQDLGDNFRSARRTCAVTPGWLTSLIRRLSLFCCPAQIQIRQPLNIRTSEFLNSHLRGPFAYPKSKESKGTHQD